ncbi:hypothetical protein LOAG_04955 [Loa loa]|uniref:Uncharacterized protein n=1 Tax=Loa loa TaxID=7209 RepID=A0A1S0U1A8_LOALO|nr:hypothetical protein LOAG_04955 [Loa loa]EFO23531.1 hypothetical protein LOAG_04955 [Loa loa]
MELIQMHVMIVMKHLAWLVPTEETCRALPISELYSIVLGEYSIDTDQPPTYQDPSDMGFLFSKDSLENKANTNHLVAILEIILAIHLRDRFHYSSFKHQSLQSFRCVTTSENFHFVLPSWYLYDSVSSRPKEFGCDGTES